MRCRAQNLICLAVFLAVSWPPFTQAADSKKEAKLDEIGEEIQQDVDRIALEALSKYYPDDLLQGYINELGQSLVPEEAPKDLLFSFRVIGDPTPNAFAFPDGRIFLHSGLLTFVDNEAQLATILGHEIAHVIERHAVEAIRASRSIKRGLFAGLAAATTAALTKNAQTAELMGSMVLAVQGAHYNRKQEDEADVVGCRLAMSRGYDPSEGVGFFDKLRMNFGEQGRLQNLLFGTHSLNTDRARNVERLLQGDLNSEYNELRSEGKLSVGSGRLRFHASAMIRDTAFLLGERFDRYDLAKPRLESILDVRPNDPKTLWYLGKIYRLVARNEEDSNKGLDLLQRAVQADEREIYPEIRKDLALFLISRTGNTTGAIEGLKSYVVGYTAKYGRYPPDMDQVYDYLLLFGDRQWKAPEPPKQLITLEPATQLSLFSSQGTTKQAGPVTVPVSAGAAGETQEDARESKSR